VNETVVRPKTHEAAAPDLSSSKRLISLDAFRGITMALMVLVNDAGGDRSYAPLEHSKWNGWTLTDTVFPSFLWIVGVAITLSLGKRLASGTPKRVLFTQMLRRSALLYAFGLIVYLFPEFHFGTMRVLGVLQRIAICYLVASAIYLSTRWRGQLIWLGILFAVYWVAMALIPVPGYGPGNLSVEGNLAHYVDHLVLGRHNYASTRTWDPEGIISTLPAIGTTLLGILAGHLLRLKKELTERLVWMFVVGNALIAAGLICNVWLPINKKLWTDSFALFMAGLDFLVFAMFIWFVDALKFRRGIQPLVIFGMNAITVYMASELLSSTLDAVHVRAYSLHEWIYRTIFAPLASPLNASLLYAIGYVLLMYLLAYALHKRGWFLRV
jgi:predicted acyltransferase